MANHLPLAPSAHYSIGLLSSSIERSAVTGIHVWPFRFQFVAMSALYFPPGKASNVLRGTFGSLFRAACCVPECQEASSCDIAATCPYARAFEPKQSFYSATGPSGLAELPRPFVFRAQHLDGQRFETGHSFYFDVVLFERPENLLPYFVSAFRELARSGLGPARGRADLASVEDLACGMHVYEHRSFAEAAMPGLFFDLTSCEHLQQRSFRIEFLTPTELKAAGHVSSRPEFPVLFSRLRDRLSNLCACYQGGPLGIDFRALGTASREIVLRSATVRQVDVVRHSSRTGQRHSIGGFTGELEYYGNLTAFLPFLRAGEWTSVGRQTVWGKGLFRLLL